MKLKQMVFFRDDVSLFGSRFDSISMDRIRELGLSWEFDAEGLRLHRSRIVKKNGRDVRVDESARIPMSNIRVYTSTTEEDLPETSAADQLPPEAKSGRPSAKR